MRIEAEDLDGLRPLIDSIVEATLQKLQGSFPGPERLSYCEAEAAELLGITPKSLKELRLKGEIVAKPAGKKRLYSRDVLLRFLNNGGPKRK